MRRHLSLLMIVLLTWQSLGWASQGFGRTQNPAHLTAHWQGIPHHHHGDHTHIDDSGNSIAHLLSDGIFSAPSLISGGGWQAVAVAADSTPPPVTFTSHTPPFLEGLRRPPRPHA